MPTRIVLLFCATLLLGVFHVRAGQHNGLPPCYDVKGETCPAVMHIDKDHGTFVIASNCQPNAECTFSSPVLLGAAAQFSNTDFSCWANQTGGSYQYTTNFECYPLTISSFELMFINTTGAVIPYGTQMAISYTALGA
jgi:hypothetical protein